MLRGHGRRRVKTLSPNGWGSEDDHPEPIRRRLRDATLWDRFLIAVFFFVVGAIATGAIYWYLSNPGDGYSTSRTTATRYVTPMETMTVVEARNHFLLVMLFGGIAGAIGYAIVSLIDPYGTTTAARREEKRKRDRFELLKEAGFPVGDAEKPDPSDSNKKD